MSNRLSLLSPDLSSAWRAASQVRRRDALLAACRLIVDGAIAEPAVCEAWKQLNSGQEITAEIKAKIVALAARVDDAYLELIGTQGSSDFAMTRFHDARRLAALSFACEDDSDAWAEAIYEASHAIGDDASKLVESVQSALRGRN